MKTILLINCIFFSFVLSGQNKQPEDYGFKHLQTFFRGDTVDILIKSKKGEEAIKKPLLLFCQGSLPIPLIIKYEMDGIKGIYNVLLFNTDSLCKDFHIAIIGKPHVPLIADETILNADKTYVDNTKKFPAEYVKRNLLDYYVDRNIAVIKFLQKQNWISTEKLVVAGHSEGSTIAAKIAFKFSKVTQLIYSGGNPLGRIMSIIERQRMTETDSTKEAENGFIGWERVVADPEGMDVTEGDTHKATYDFSIPPMQYLEKLKIPVLVCYGTKDAGCPFNDYFRIEMMRQKKKNFTFNAYIGTEHNYFPLKPDGEIDYEIFNWNRVVNDWRKWLMQQ